MTTRWNVDVEQVDLYRAERGVSTTCAVSQAIARQIPGAMRIDVDTQTIRFTLDDKRLVFLTPLLVQQYVSDFDAGLPIGTLNQPGKLLGPFSFSLRDPIAAPRRIGSNAATKANKAIPSRSGPRGGLLPGSGNPRALKGTGTTVYPDGPYRTPPPKVFRSRSRTYGHRVLRWNQPEPKAETVEPSA